MRTLAVSLITATRPAHLSKGFSLADDGTMIKTLGGQLADGIVETKCFSDFQSFVDALAGLTPANAMSDLAVQKWNEPVHRPGTAR